MKWFKKIRYLYLAIWAIIAVVAVLFLPNMSDLAQTKGQISLPASSQTSKSADLSNIYNGGSDQTYDLTAVYTSSDGKKISKAEKKDLKDTLKNLELREEQYGITNLTSFATSKSVANRLNSKDGMTTLVQISVDKSQGNVKEVANSLTDALSTDGLKLRLTGEDLITYDFASTTQTGVKRTEIIAIIFILVVLILVFRSPIVPIASLLTVGISYLVSLSVVGNLVQSFNFPFSTFTQVFLVVVLFGIGTDYNILMYSRFREQLGIDDDPVTAALAARKTAGRTIFYSGTAVLIGFAALGLANFQLYKATSAVALGVLVMLFVMSTLNPAIMSLLGKTLFWPSKKFNEPETSKLWTKFSSFAVGKPILTILAVLLVTVPLAVTNNKPLNFNDLWEVSDVYDSKSAVQTIEDHYPAGYASPATVYIHSKNAMNNNEALAIIDNLTGQINNLNGVASVAGPTRPTAEKITSLYTASQSATLSDKLDDAKTGTKTISKSLTDASSQLNSTDQLASAAAPLTSSTNDLANGASELQGALSTLTSGMQSGQSSAAELSSNLSNAVAVVNGLATTIDTLNASVPTLTANLRQTADTLGAAQSALATANQGFTSIRDTLNGDASVNQNGNVQSAIQTAGSNIDSLTASSQSLANASAMNNDMVTSAESMSSSLSQIADSVHQLQAALTQMQAGAGTLSSSLDSGSSAAGEVSTKSGALTSGLSSLQSGQQQLSQGISDLQSQSKELQSGLSEGSDGLNKIGKGLGTATTYLSDLSNTGTSVFYVPADVLKGKTFKSALTSYMSADHKTLQLQVIMDENPFSRSAMPVSKNIQKVATNALRGTKLAGSEVAIAGTAARNDDLKKISEADFIRTAAIMLAGILLVLIIITRSLIKPILIVLGLLLSYGAALHLGQLLIAQVMDTNELSWNVPFFSFIMLVALGVDYSIFLMMRYREAEGNASTRMVTAAGVIGAVVLSAALILAGTFAALIPSGVLSLIEVATVVIIGLAFLSLIVMPLFLPAGVALANKLLVKAVENES